MDNNKFLALLGRARRQYYVGLRTDYWHGYQRGLRRGFHSEVFGTDAEHEVWLRLADDGSDEVSRERGRGYRDGFRTGKDTDDGPPSSESILSVASGLGK